MPSFNLGLRGRLYVGFAVLIAFGLLVAGYGIHGLSVTAGSIARLENVAANLLRVEEVARQLEIIRRGANRYRLDGDAGNEASMKAAEDSAARLLADATATTVSEERRKLYSRISETFRAAVADREAFVGSYKAAFAERAKLFVGGDVLTAATARLVEATLAASDPALGSAAARVEAAILLVRVANWRYLATLDPKGVTTFNANQAKADSELTALEQSAGPDIKPLIGAVKDALKEYAASFSRVSTGLTAGSDQFNNGLLPRIVTMEQDAAQALASLRDNFKAISDTSKSSADTTIWLQAIVAGAASLIGMALAFLIGRGIVGPITSMTGAMARLAAGDNEIEVPGRKNTDEIGAMARAVEVFKQNAIENVRLNGAKVTEQALRDRRQAAMDAQTQDFGTSVSGVMASLGSSADKMHAAANEMTEAAKNTRLSTSGAVDGANASARDLNSVAVAAEQMAASISEISRQVAHVTTAVGKAVERASETTQKVVKLSETADRISDVVRLITDIAGQTNLLALNATIEAARAGEAGKGFAVVASEVKALATQTARATDQIGAQIVAIRESTAEAVEAVRDVGSAISQVAEVATAIAAAVEQQAAATKEISSSVQGVTRATTESAQAMEQVLGIAQRTDLVSQSVLTAAGEVGETAGTLRVEVNDFLSAMKRSDVYERRAYERLPGRGATAWVTIRGSEEMTAVIRDISRGGIALLTSADAASGTDVQVRLAGGATVAGRVVRFAAGVLSVAFRQDSATIGVVDRALESFERGERGLAA